MKRSNAQSPELQEKNATRIVQAHEDYLAVSAHYLDKAEATLAKLDGLENATESDGRTQQEIAGLIRHARHQIDQTRRRVILDEAIATPQLIELARSSDEEKQSQLTRLAAFHALHADESPAMLAALQQAVIEDGNVFEKLMDAVRVCSLGQITDALFEVDGQYRRSM
ncbi:methylmalonyl-CoA mutase family protein [Actimicrobium sp. CCI2.3]|nr:methylmalonyl-CoA mutase family protein [Actimicrobium sp. CCI2.3]